MHATAVETIAPQSKGPLETPRRILPPTFSFMLRWGFLALIAIVAVLSTVLGLMQKWLWMRQLDYAGIFWTLLSVKWGIFGVTLIVSVLYLWVNLRFAARNIDLVDGESFFSKAFKHPVDASRTINFDVSPKLMVFAIDFAIVALSLIFALSVSGQWDTYLRFRYGGPFGVADPLFGIDLGFYVFRLPFYEMVQGSITVLTVGALAILSFCALFGVRQSKSTGKITLSDGIAQHFIVLLFILVANFGWGFILDHYQLVYSSLGVVHGAGYAAAHVTRAALWVMTGASALACVLLAIVFFRTRSKHIVAGIVTYAALYVVAVLAVPFLFQTFVVKPNELSLETPYLNHYIDYTRRAYRLDGIQETAYPALADLTPDVIARNEDTIQNIRLWDTRPLLQTYQQTQAIRLYYDFYNVNVDRYHLADGFHQVMLSPRELASQLPAQAQTWLNENLEFTHGEGLVMNFVSNSTGGGLPQYLLENIPAESQYGLKITQPEIYYGNVAPGYKIVDTGIKEFDYPKGNENVYSKLSRHGRNSPRQRLEEASVCMDTEGHQHSADRLSEAAKQNSDLEGRARARLPSRAFPASGPGSVCSIERREAILDTGRLYGLGSLPLFKRTDERLRPGDELHPQFRQGCCGYV